MANECSCGTDPRLIFACSGAADLGSIADQSARKLAENGAGKMFCLAGIGGRVSGILKSTEAASAILVIDGCELDCAKYCLEQAGFSAFKYLRVGDLGMGKGSSSPATERIQRVVNAARQQMVNKR